MRGFEHFIVWVNRPGNKLKNHLTSPAYISKNNHAFKIKEKGQLSGVGKFSFVNRTMRDSAEIRTTFRIALTSLGVC